MGKNKKGKGAEKTAAKTEKKLSKKQKKELADLGEDDVEKIVAQIQQEEEKKSAIIESTIEKPLKRSGFQYVAHPDKDELILFGGEFFNGQKATMFNDLLFYNISQRDWTCVKAPGAPAPRSSHQMVAVPGKGGQLWVFGGEFSSNTQTQFYHYKDLYCFHLGEKRWQKIKDIAGGPSPRSGCRMVLCKRQIILFGGYNDNTVDYKYFNDVYAFDLNDYKWKKLEPTGVPPAARSGFQMATLPSGKVLVSGGYSRQRIKKDVDKGTAHIDSFLLTPERGDETGTKWKWVSVKLGGISPYPRLGMSITMAPAGRCFAFGGVRDEEGEEDLSGTFHNDVYNLDLEKTSWRQINLTGKKDTSAAKARRRRRKEGEAEGGDEEEADKEEEEEEMEAEVPETKVTTEDGIFTMTVGPSPVVSQTGETTVVTSGSSGPTAFSPSPRMNAGLAYKQGKLYMYGGIIEDGDRQYTLSDMYSLDVHKLDEWTTIIAPEKDEEWINSSSSSEDDDEDDDEEEGSESPMDTD